MKKHVLILAGGKGTRMGKKIPKQFQMLSGKPLLFHTFNAFLHIADVRFTLVLNSDYVDYWKTLCKEYQFNFEHDIVIGGDSRFQSVKNGLKNISDTALVLIHDGVRPFVSKKTITMVIETATIYGNSVPVVDLTDSIRKVSGQVNEMVNRNNFKSVQTPQAFHASVIKTAYTQKYQNIFTDDATVLEYSGAKINIVPGNHENIKISNEIDLEIAKVILNKLDL